MDRALREFRVRGVKTNIPFLENLLSHPTFVSGEATTTFIDNTPELFRFRPRRDRATKILSYLGDVIINGRPDVKGKIDPKRELPEPLIPPYPHRHARRRRACGTSCWSWGRRNSAEWVRKQKQLLFTDTTMRDAHQSLLATRVRTHDLLAIADAVAHLLPELVQPGDVGRRDVRHGDAIPAGRPVGPARPASHPHPQHPVPDAAAGQQRGGIHQLSGQRRRANSSRQSAAHGIDVFRIFDSLNWTENMKVAMEAVREHTNSICEAAICYTGDILDPKRTKYSLKYYVKHGQGTGEDGDAYSGDQGHGRACASPMRLTRW